MNYLRKLLAAMTGICLTGLATISTAYAGTFVQGDTGIIYYNDSEELVVDSFVYEGNEIYKLDEDGNLVTDSWIKVPELNTFFGKKYGLELLLMVN